MIEVKLESGGKGRVFVRRRVWWMLAVLLMMPGLVVGQKPKKKSTHPAATLKKRSAKGLAHSSGHAATSHPATRSKGHTAIPAHGKRRSSRYIAPAPVIRSKYGAARPVQETAQVPVVRVPQQVPATPVPEADAPGLAAQQETAPADESLYADSVLPPAQPQPFRYPRALDSFFKALAAEQASRTAGVADVSGAGSIVRIMQFGDSHTAADIFTGQMRALLQAKFGNGGLGFQYPGHPFAGYRLLGSSRSQTPGWTTQGNHFTDLGDGDTGLGGIAISTRRPGESVFLTTTCETLQVQYLRQPGGGALDFSDNGQPVSEIKTGADSDPGDGGTQMNSALDASLSRGAGTFTYSCTPGEHEFQLITMDSAPVRLLGLVTEQAGVTYECLGINGAVAPLILKWNQQMFADYLGQRNPNLIVLAYGTNEAAESASRNDEYVAELHEVLQNLHRIVPGASILMLGPYDRALKVGRGRHAAWHTQEAIDRIIADQKEACKVDGCAFYDERARMGGPGTMQRWFNDGLAQGDRTHLTGTGYRVLANALYRDLMTAYNNYLRTADKAGGEAPAASQ